MSSGPNASLAGTDSLSSFSGFSFFSFLSFFAFFFFAAFDFSTFLANLETKVTTRVRVFWAASVPAFFEPRVMVCGTFQRVKFSVLAKTSAESSVRTISNLPPPSVGGEPQKGIRKRSRTYSPSMTIYSVRVQTYTHYKKTYTAVPSTKSPFAHMSMQACNLYKNGLPMIANELEVLDLNDLLVLSTEWGNDPLIHLYC